MRLVYRHEIKHVIDAGDKAAICANMRVVADADPHAGPDGHYLVRSLYFDSPGDSALREKIDGVNEREKFRIRYYNGDPSVMRLEKKVRRNGLGYKVSAPVTAWEVRRLLAGDLSWMPVSGRGPVIELYSKMKSRGLRPRTIVDYTRTPFVYGPGNVRVTIDENIRAGVDLKAFMDPGSMTVPVGQGIIVLEVKWDEYLPTVIRRAVQVKNRRSTAFSKYQICRIYG